MSDLFKINCLWVGPRLRPLEQVCLLSMLKQGHRVQLFSYGKIEDVPSGIDVEDARDILPEESFLIHSKRRSASLGSNVFRYRLMKENHGLWLDTDVILLQPIARTEEVLFGFEDDKSINGAVLFLPNKSDILNDLLQYVSTPYPVPPFLERKKRTVLRLRKMAGLPKHVQDMNWGVYGPLALTHFAKKSGVEHKAKKTDVFYPVADHDAHKLFSASWNVAQFIKPTTLTVHLWNDKLRRPSPIRPDNPIGKLLVERNSFVERYARQELNFHLDNE